jgi:hypothetical protein
MGAFRWSTGLGWQRVLGISCTPTAGSFALDCARPGLIENLTAVAADFPPSTNGPHRRGRARSTEGFWQSGPYSGGILIVKSPALL